MKKIIKYFSIVLFSAFFMFLLASDPTSAIYDSEKNTVRISVNKNEVKIAITYQRGMGSGTSAQYFWCGGYDVAENKCLDQLGESVNYVSESQPKVTSFVSREDATVADRNLTTVTFTIPKEKDSLLKDLSGKEGQSYVLVVSTAFCAVRNDAKTSCNYYDTPKITTLTVSVNNLVNGSGVDGSFGTDVDIKDSGISTLMDKVSDIVMGTVLPIIWAVLGLFLVIKGALLGVQIVNSADEPQVRQEKIGSLKWLVIGVAIAYAASGVVAVLTSFFSGAFKGGE